MSRFVFSERPKAPLGGRFSAMVLMPSTMRLVIHGVREGLVAFTVLTEDGQPAFSEGFVCFE